MDEERAQTTEGPGSGPAPRRAAYEADGRIREALGSEAYTVAQLVELTGINKGVVLAALRRLGARAVGFARREGGIGKAARIYRLNRTRRVKAKPQRKPKAQRHESVDVRAQLDEFAVLTEERARLVLRVEAIDARCEEIVAALGGE